MRNAAAHPVATFVTAVLLLGVVFVVVCTIAAGGVSVLLSAEPPAPVRPWFAYERQANGPERPYWPMRSFVDGAGNWVDVDVPNNVVLIESPGAVRPSPFRVRLFEFPASARVPLALPTAPGAPPVRPVGRDALVLVDDRGHIRVAPLAEPGFAARFVESTTTADGWRLVAAVEDTKQWLATQPTHESPALKPVGD